MIELWIGDNIYQIKKSKDDLARQYQDYVTTNLILGSDNEADIVTAIMMPDLFSQNKIFFIKLDIWPTDKIIKDIKLASSSSRMVVLLLSSTRKTEKTLKALDIDIKYFPVLSLRDMSIWLDGELDKMNLLADVKKFIANNLSGINDQQYIHNELAKLSNAKNLDLVLAKKLIIPIINTNIFDLLDAVISGNKKKAMSILVASRQNGEDESRFHTMLGWQLSSMVTVKMSQILKEPDMVKIAKINPYVASKIAAKVKSMSKQQLLNIIKSYIGIITIARKNNSSDALLSEMLIESIGT